MYKLQSRLGYIRNKIKEWNVTVFGNIFKEKAIIEEKLEQIHKGWTSGDKDQDSADQEKILMQQWQLHCQQEETLWKQKSRIQCFKEGEQNTKFFHRSALDYRGAIKILSLNNEKGDTLQSHQEVATLLTKHFNNIAQEPRVDRTKAIEELTKSIPKSITNEKNLALTREISLEEVEEAVKSMPNDKAPGPNGFTIKFYKACWKFVKTDVWEVVEDSRRSSSILKSLNSTFLTLIPKEAEANTATKFRPIALCNVI